MKRFILFAFFFVGILSCGTNNFSSDNIQDIQEPSLTITAANLEYLKGAVGRFEWWKRYEDPHIQPTFVSYGTAWCASIIPGISLWITCEHVAQEDGLNLYAVLRYNDKNGMTKTYDIKNITKSHNSDIAFFSCDFEPESKLDLPKDIAKNISALGPLQVFVAIGCPSGLFPPVVTVGVFKDKYEDGLWFDCGMWNGSSGSPVIDVRTMRVLGMIYQYRDFPPRQSNKGMAIPSNRIVDFLSEHKK